MIPTTSLIVLLSAILAVLGDVQRPTQGHQVGNGTGSGADIIFPSTITQCEPVLIFYNLTDRDYVYFFPPDNNGFLALYFPAGVGYLDWICDLPTGYSFYVGYQYGQYYTVQPGSSSACLGDITTTYSYASYYTTLFQSYTQHSPSGNPLYSALYKQPTIDFPTSSFPTITANPNLAVTSTTTTSVSSTSSSLPTSSTPVSSIEFPFPVASPPASSLPTSSTPVSSIEFPSPVASSPASPHKSKKTAIAGSVVGGVALLLFTLAIIFVFLRKRRSSYHDAALMPHTLSPGWMTTQPEPSTNFSTAVLPSSDQEITFSNTDSIEIRPNIGQMSVPDIPLAIRPDAREQKSPSVTATGTFSSLTRIAPHTHPKPSNLASTLGTTHQLTTSQRLALVASMHTPPAHAPEISSSPDVQMTIPLSQPLTGEVQNDDPDLAAVLGDILRTQWSERDRQALVTNLFKPGQPGPAQPTNTVSSPPPYSG